MITIIFESHGATADNENNIASGWNDPPLSELGQQHARDLGKRRDNEHFDAIFCSDLRRSWETAHIAFANKIPIIQDQRLRECHYGDLAGKPSAEIEEERGNHITLPFSNGKSYTQTAERMRLFLADLMKNYANQKVLIIGHRATQYGLEHWIKGVDLKKAVTAPWHWQPGWEYVLKKLQGVIPLP